MGYFEIQTEYTFVHSHSTEDHSGFPSPNGGLEKHKKGNKQPGAGW